MKGEANKAWATTTLSLHHCCSKCRLSPFVHHLYTSAAVSTERKQDISQPPIHLKRRSLQEWTTEQVQKISCTITWHKEIPRYWKLLRVHDVILGGKYLIPNGYVPFVRSYLSTGTDGSLNRCINLTDIRIRISLNTLIKTSFNVIKLTTLTRKQEKKIFYLQTEYRGDHETWQQVVRQFHHSWKFNIFLFTFQWKRTFLYFFMI
jgi:hypothetical protein